MNAKEQAQARWDHVAKPLNSLGKLEKLIVKIADVQNTPDVRIDKRCALVFCGDHGVVEEGVTQSGQEVTALVAKSIAEGTANVNLMASTAQADVFAVDMGMVQDVFDTSYFGDYNPETAAPTLMSVRNLIEGFSTAIQYMVEGDDWMIFIPYTLAYGSEGSGKIPGYSTLQFRVHMVRWYESGTGTPGGWE